MFHPRLYFCALVEESLAVQIQFGAVGADNLFLFIAGFHLHFFELDDGLEGGGAFFGAAEFLISTVVFSAMMDSEMKVVTVLVFWHCSPLNWPGPSLLARSTGPHDQQLQSSVPPSTMSKPMNHHV